MPFRIKLLVLVLMLSITTANLILAHPGSRYFICEEAQQGTQWCDMYAQKECKAQCGGVERCWNWWWCGNYCYHAVCFESWTIQCTTGPDFGLDCRNMGICPLK